MQIKIICVGKRMPAWVNTACADYTKRFPSSYSLKLIEVNAEKRQKNSNISQLCEKEGKLIQQQLAPDDYVIALDERGHEMSTIAFANKINHWHHDNQNIALLIGGPDGLDSQCKQRANELLALSRLTLPHPLVRVFLIEQLYRAIMINQGHPYHRN